jgi:PAS domain S-box-containing protein
VSEPTRTEPDAPLLSIYAQILDALPIGVFVLDAEGHPFYVNVAAKNLLGRGIDPSASLDTIGEVYQVFIEGTDEPLPRSRVASAKALQGISSRVDNIEIKRPDGRIPIESWVGPLFDADGNVTHAMSAFADVTERRLAERELKRNQEQLARLNDELQASNEAVRDFVAVASHDLRGPLAAIIGWASVLADQLDSFSDEDKVKYLRVIERQGHQISRLVDDLLLLSRIDAGAVDHHAERLVVRDVLADIVESLGEEAAGVTIECDPALEVSADRDHLERIVSNYLTNAARYGESPITIRANAQDGFASVHVCDRGEGVPDAFVPRLFEKFARADVEASRKKKGTGLGLSIVRGLAQANGGDAWYEPNHPGGSCFAVKLPLPRSSS